MGSTTPGFSLLLAAARHLALVYALGLAIAEAAINSSREHWQYAPLWIIDYLIAGGLLLGFWLTRRGRCLPVLMAAYALSTGVMYLAFFLNLDPELPEAARGPGLVVALIGLALGVSAAGLASATAVWWRQERAT